MRMMQFLLNNMLIVALLLPANFVEGYEPLIFKDDDRPFLAIWRNYDGFTSKGEAPYLRIAMWDDGRVVFSPEVIGWNHTLQKGRIAAYRVERIKRALMDLGVFKLEKTGYGIPSMPQDLILLDLGEGKRKVLSGIDGDVIRRKARAGWEDYVRCWESIKTIAAIGCPDDFEKVTERFESVPKSWLFWEEDEPK